LTQATTTWNGFLGAFVAIIDPKQRLFEDNWKRLRSMLEGRKVAITPKEIRECWPTGADCPGISTLYEWLAQAYSKKRLRREGSGSRSDPWRYRLKNADDEY